MPVYIYENTKTGKVWEENLSYEDRDKPVSKNVIRIPAATSMFRILDSNENKIRDHLGVMAQQGYKERDTLEKKGLIKVSNAEKESREKRQQKRKWV
jgi:hypothetical protein